MSRGDLSTSTINAEAGSLSPLAFVVQRDGRISDVLPVTQWLKNEVSPLSGSTITGGFSRSFSRSASEESVSSSSTLPPMGYVPRPPRALLQVPDAMSEAGGGIATTGQALEEDVDELNTTLPGVPLFLAQDEFGNLSFIGSNYVSGEEVADISAAASTCTDADPSCGWGGRVAQ